VQNPHISGLQTFVPRAKPEVDLGRAPHKGAPTGHRECLGSSATFPGLCMVPLYGVLRLLKLKLDAVMQGDEASEF